MKSAEPGWKGKDEPWNRASTLRVLAVSDVADVNRHHRLLEDIPAALSLPITESHVSGGQEFQENGGEKEKKQISSYVTTSGALAGAQECGTIKLRKLGQCW